MRVLMIAVGSQQTVRYVKDRLTSGYAYDERNETIVAWYKDIAIRCGDEDDGCLIIKGEKVPLPDLAMVVYGDYGAEMPYEITAVLRMLVTRGVVCINSHTAVEKTRDKMYTLQVVKETVPEALVPRTMLVNSDTTVEEIEEFIGYPVVVKVMHGSQGKGVTLVEDRKALVNLMDILGATKVSDQILAQQAITASKGRDLRIMTAAGKYLYSFRRCNENSFRSNVSGGGHVEKVDDLPQSVIDIAERVSKAFGLVMGSVDFLYGEGPEEFYVCEVNSSPDVTKYEGAEEVMKRALEMIAAEYGFE